MRVLYYCNCFYWQLQITNLSKEDGQIATKFGIDAESFMLKMKNSLYKKLAEAGFKKFAKLNVIGFPLVFVGVSKTYYCKIESAYMPLAGQVHNHLSVRNKI